MTDPKPVNAKPFSSSTLKLSTQKSKTITDVSSLKVTSLSNSNLAPGTTGTINQITSTKAFDLSSLKTPSGTLAHGASISAPSVLDLKNQATDSANSDTTANENNNQTEDISSENQIKQYLTNLQPNILNDYDQSTYHLKVFLANAEVIKNPAKSIDELLEDDPNLFDDDRIIIIAESGVNAGIYVDSFTITNVVTIDPQFNTSGVKASMVLKEPLGANFIDYFNGAIDVLGYETRVQAPIFIEISFRGYDENGNYIVADTIGTKMYRMSITNIVADFKGTGAEYSIEMTVMSDIARQIANSSIVDNLSIQGKTVQDFVDKLMAEWNKYQRDIEANESQPPAQTTGTTAAVPTGNKDAATLPSTDNKQKPTPAEKNVFKFKIADTCVEYKDCLSWEVGKASNPDRHRATDTNFNDNKGMIEATWASGTDRFSILYDILYSTIEAQTLIINGKKEKEIKPGSKNPSGISYLPEFDVGVELLEYNGETHTYNKEITYTLQERETTQVFSTPEELEKAQDNPDALKEKLKFVRRRYDYFGTGKNTEIVEFAIKIEKNLLMNLPAYNAQKRVAVADNPGTGDKTIQNNQVAGSNKAKLGEGVKPPTPVDPDKQKNTSDPTNGAKTTSAAPLAAETKTSPVLNGDKTKGSTATPTPTVTNAEIAAATKKLNDYHDQVVKNLPNMTQDQIHQANLEQQRLKDDAYALIAVKMTQDQAKSDQALKNQMAAIDQQLASVAGQSRPMDSVTPNNNRQLSPLPTTPQTGTLAHGANANYVNNTVNNPVSRNNALTSTSKLFLEDFARNRADSPKSDIAFRRPVVSTPIQNKGGYNLDDSSTLGKSFITAILSQVYGGFGDMNSVSMEVRGDPLWLGVTNKAHTDQMGSLVIKNENGKKMPPSDHKLLLVVVFPTQYDENTGLAIPDKIAEGYTAFYNIKSVVSTFQSGKFTQTLELYQDLCTEQVRKYIDPQGGANL